MVGKQLIENVIQQIGTKVKTDYVHKVTGKGLSTEDYTTVEKTKLSNIEANAEVNVIEYVKVNGTSQAVTNKAVDIEVPTKVSDITNDSGFIDNTVNNLVNYELKTNTGSSIALSIDSSTYVVTMQLKNSAGTVLSQDTIDLPLETMVIGASYDNNTKKIILTLKNGTTVDFSVADLIEGLQNEITANNKLNADLVDDTSSTHKFTTAGDISKLSGIENGAEVNIIETVKVDGTALPVTDKAVDITGKENTSNKVTAIDENSTDTQYPSAKCVYDRVAELEEENALLRKDIAGLPTDTATPGESIDIADSAEMRFEKLQIGGNSKQTQYSGKNLLSFNAINTQTVNGVNITNNKDGSITLNGTAESIVSLQISDIMDGLQVGEYYLSINANGGVSSNINKILYGNKETPVVLASLSTDNVAVTVDDEQPNYYLWLYINSGTQFTNYTIKPQLELGSTATDYEPYTGGQPSPNPDYPQEIHNVGDNGSVNVTVGNKNLFDGKFTLFLPQVNLDYTDNNLSRTLSCSNLAGNKYCTFGGYFKAGTYTFSINLINHWYSLNRAAIAGSTVAPAFEHIRNSYTWTQNVDGYTYFSIERDTSESDYEDIEFDDYNLMLQIELGSTATSYTPHEHQTYTIPTQQPMRKIGNYADTFVKENGKWYEKHVIWEVVLDGSEDGWAFFRDESYIYNYYINIPTMAKNINKCFSNYFMYSHEGTHAIGTFGIGGTNPNKNGNVVINPSDDTTNKLSDFCYWLSIHNTKICYPLEVPTLLTCTAEQTAVLEEIRKKAKSYKGGTHIYSTDEVSPVFDVEYHVDLQNENENLQLQLDSLEARVSLLEGGE